MTKHHRNDYAAALRKLVRLGQPTDFLQMDSQRLPDGSFHDPPNSPESQLLGGPIQTLRAAATAANPITYVTGEDSPFLIQHGDHDRQVPYQQSELLHQALTRAGVETRLHILPGAGHSTSEFLTDEIGQMMVEFFDRHLKRPGRS